jgi:hypothetical protein
MLQLNKSQSINTIALLPETPVLSGSTGLELFYSQDYNDNTGGFGATIISNNQNTDWLIAHLSGSVLPNPSGQYTLDIYQGIKEVAIWNLTSTLWDRMFYNWDDASMLASASFTGVSRAIVVGTDVVSTPQYQSPDETGYYKTYLG